LSDRQTPSPIILQGEPTSRNVQMPNIHPSSDVDPLVEMAPDVTIGPRCTIEGRVTIGAGTKIIGNAWLRGPLTIGSNNIIYPSVYLGFDAQHRTHFDPSLSGGVSIGNDNIIRENVTIHRSTGPQPTTVGDRNFLMVGSHLGHDVVVGDDCTLVNNAAVGGHAHIHNQVILGGSAGVHQFCRVGRLSMLSASMLIVQDLPPFCTCYNSREVGSLNLIGLRRAGLLAHIRPLHDAFVLLYRSNHTIPVALGLIEAQCGHDPLVRELLAFVRASKRGITRSRISSRMGTRTRAIGDESN
jgi:UDP-N-acetylglucosamine acyltransferase